VSIVIGHDLFCDRCPQWNGDDAGAKSAKLARAYGKHRGWVRRRNAEGKIEDLCPRCAKTSGPAKASGPAHAPGQE
jgi:hypothetical protein